MGFANLVSPDSCSRKLIIAITSVVIAVGIVFVLSGRSNLFKNYGKFRHTPPSKSYGRKDWFDQILLDPQEVRKWNSDEMDENFHKLSHWTSFNSSQWLQWVDKSLHGLAPPMHPSRAFTFLEIGSGVGAFSRVVLSKYPRSSGMGVDRSKKAVSIANSVLPTDRIKSLAGDARSMEKVPNFYFDYVIVPGVLCYLSNLSNVKLALLEMVIKAKSGASIAITMLPLENVGSCNIKIEQDFWTSPYVKALGLTVLKFDFCNGCGLSHAEGRYTVFLKVNRAH